MAVKAVAIVTNVTAQLNSTFTVDVHYAFMDASSQSSGNINGIGPFSPAILGTVLQGNIATAVKDALSITGLDTVRLIGADILGGL